MLNKKFESYLNNRVVCAVILFLISFSIFIPSLKNDFVWDDIIYVKHSLPALKNFSFSLSSLIPERKKIRYKGHFGVWRPMAQSSWALDAKTWGSSPSGFHLTNNILHAISTVLLFYLCILIFKEFNRSDALKISFLSSLIFALHPVHVETVSFISARSDLLCSLFVLLSMIFFVLSYKKLYFILLSLPCFYLALLSKETAIVVPLLILSYAFLRDFKNGFVSKSSVILVVCFSILLILYYSMRTRIYSIIPNFVDVHFTGTRIFSNEFINYLNYVLISLTYYVNKLVYPFEFNAFVGKLDYSIKNLSSAYAVTLLLLSLVLLSIKRKKYLFVYSILWIIITLIPAVGVSIINLTTSPFSERFLYIPSAGYSIIVALFTVELVDFKYNRMIKYTIVILVLVVFLLFNLKEQFVWKNDITLWGTTIKRSPGYVTPHLNYGYSLLDNGNLNDAEEQFLIALDPEIEGRKIERVNAASNLGNLYIREQKFELAETYFRKALKLNRRYKATYYYHMGLINYIRGNLEYMHDNVSADNFYNKAEDYLLKSSKIAPRYGRLNLLLAEVYLKLGQIKKAKDYARKSLKSSKKGMLDELMIKRVNEIINMEK